MFFNHNTKTIYGKSYKTIPKYKRQEIIKYGRDLLELNELSDKEKIYKYAKRIWEEQLYICHDQLHLNPNGWIDKFISDQKDSQFGMFNRDILYRPNERPLPSNVELEMIFLDDLTDPYHLMQDYFMGSAIVQSFEDAWLCYSSETKRIFVVDIALRIYNITGGAEEVIKNKEFLVPFDYAYPKSEIPDFTYSLNHSEFRMLHIFTKNLDKFYENFIECFDKKFLKKLQLHTY